LGFLSSNRSKRQFRWHDSGCAPIATKNPLIAIGGKMIMRGKNLQASNHTKCILKWIFCLSCPNYFQVPNSYIWNGWIWETYKKLYSFLTNQQWSQRSWTDFENNCRNIILLMACSCYCQLWKNASKYLEWFGNTKNYRS
jgi:hypothetical protein